MTSVTFFEWLYGPEILTRGEISVSVMVNGRPKPRGFTDPTQAHDYCQQWKSKGDVYFNLGLVEEVIGTRRGGNAQTIALPGFCIDIDVDKPNKDYFENVDEAMAYVRSLDLRPSIIVKSGSGLHVYWLFDDLWWFRDAAERERAHQLSRAWYHYLRSCTERALDPTWDISHWYRPPRTVNHKYDTNVTQIFHDPKARYRLEQFEALTMAREDRAVEAMSTEQHEEVQVEKHADAVCSRRVQNLIINDSDFSDMWTKMTSLPGDSSQSQYDWHLMMAMRDAGCTPQEVTDALIHNRRMHEEDLNIRNGRCYYEMMLSKISWLHEDSMDDRRLYEATGLRVDQISKTGKYPNTLYFVKVDGEYYEMEKIGKLGHWNDLRMSLGTGPPPVRTSAQNFANLMIELSPTFVDVTPPGMTAQERIREIWSELEETEVMPDFGNPDEKESYLQNLKTGHPFIKDGHIYVTARFFSRYLKDREVEMDLPSVLLCMEMQLGFIAEKVNRLDHWKKEVSSEAD
jgi:hypothetical protein